MKALSLIQPWASLMAHRLKRVETRAWSTRYTGLVAIHASAGQPRYARDFEREIRAETESLPAVLPRGAVIAVVQLLGTMRTEEVVRTEHVSGTELMYGDYSPGRWAWFTKPVLTLREPIPCKGALGLWLLPALVEERLLRELDAVR